MRSNLRRSISPHDEAVLEQILIELIEDAKSVGSISDAEVRAAFYSEGHIPSAEHDQMLGQLLLEGPGHYLSVIVRGLNERCDVLLSQLLALKDDEDRRTSLSRIRDISKGRYQLLLLFQKGYPKPPFSIIEHVLPVHYEVIVHRWWRPRDSQLEGYLCDLILEVPVIEDYLKKPERTLPRNRILRFFASHCHAVKRRRFLRAIHRLIIAAESLRGYLLTYLEPYLLNLHFQQVYQDYAD